MCAIGASPRLRVYDRVGAAGGSARMLEWCGRARDRSRSHTRLKPASRTQPCRTAAPAGAPPRPHAAATDPATCRTAATRAIGRSARVSAFTRASLCLRGHDRVGAARGSARVSASHARLCVCVIPASARVCSGLRVYARVIVSGSPSTRACSRLPAAPCAGLCLRGSHASSSQRGSVRRLVSARLRAHARVGPAPRACSCGPGTARKLVVCACVGQNHWQRVLDRKSVV